MPTVHDLSQPLTSGISNDIDVLIASPEYRDPNSVQGQQIREIVRNAYDIKFGKADLTRRPNPLVIEIAKDGSTTQSHLMRPKG